MHASAAVLVLLAASALLAGCAKTDPTSQAAPAMPQAGRVTLPSACIRAPDSPPQPAAAPAAFLRGNASEVAARLVAAIGDPVAKVTPAETGAFAAETRNGRIHVYAAVDGVVPQWTYNAYRNWPTHGSEQRDTEPLLEKLGFLSMASLRWEGSPGMRSFQQVVDGHAIADTGGQVDGRADPAYGMRIWMRALYEVQAPAALRDYQEVFPIGRDALMCSLDAEHKTAAQGFQIEAQSIPSKSTPIWCAPWPSLMDTLPSKSGDPTGTAPVRTP